MDKDTQCEHCHCIGHSKEACPSLAYNSLDVFEEPPEEQGDPPKEDPPKGEPPAEDTSNKKGKEKAKDTKKETHTMQTRSTVQRSPIKKKDAPKHGARGDNHAPLPDHPCQY